MIAEQSTRAVSQKTAIYVKKKHDMCAQLSIYIVHEQREDLPAQLHGTRLGFNHLQ